MGRAIACGERGRSAHAGRAAPRSAVAPHVPSQGSPAGSVPAAGDDLAWVGESMLHTTQGLAVYVFHGEATIGGDLVVTHRGPGRDRLLGGVATGAVRVDWGHAVHPEDRALHRAAESYVQLSKGLPIAASFRIVGMDGVTRWVSEHLAPRWEHGRLLVDGVVIDVTSQRVARTEAEQAQRRLEAVMRSANTYVWVAEVGADGVMTSVYSVAGIERIMGRGVEETGPVPRWRSVVHPDDVDRFDAVIVAAGHGRSFDIEYRLNGLDGVTRIVRDQAVATLLGNGRYRLDGLVQEVTADHEARRALGAALAIAEDRAEEVEELLVETSSLHALAEAARLAAEDHAHRLAAAHAELERIGRLDSLTGLTNRRYATKVMDEALARRDPVGIAMLDVDGFKRVNDTYGHAGGDAVLIEIARRLAATRAEDLVARWGGEEFCVLSDRHRRRRVAVRGVGAPARRGCIGARPARRRLGRRHHGVDRRGPAEVPVGAPGVARDRRRRGALRGEARRPQQGVPRARAARGVGGPPHLLTVDGVGDGAVATLPARGDQRRLSRRARLLPDHRQLLVRGPVRARGDRRLVPRVDIEPFERSHPASFGQVNPWRRVPAICDGETEVYETGACLLYLAERFPAAALEPPPGDPSRGAYLRWLVWLSDTFRPLWERIMAPQFFTTTDLDGRARQGPRGAGRGGRDPRGRAARPHVVPRRPLHGGRHLPLHAGRLAALQVRSAHRR